MNYRIKIVQACITAFSLLAATQMGSAQEPQTWKHGLTASDLDSSFSKMASIHDFATNQGVDLEFVKFNSDALALKALIAGEIDSYEGNPSSPIIAASKGAEITLVGCYWPGLTYGIFSKDSIESPKDLVGKTVGISAPNSLPDILTRVILSNNGIDPKSVNFAALGNDAARFSALYAGSADAVAASTSYTPVIQEGYRLLTTALDAAPKFLRLCTYMSPQTISERRDDAVRFLVAEMDAVGYALEHRDEFLEFAREQARLGQDDPRPAYIFDEAVTYEAIDPTMPIPVERLDWLKQLLIEAKSVAKDFNVEDLIDDTLRLDALKLTKVN